MKEISPAARSLSKRLSNYATKIKVPFQYVSTAFLLERLALRLTADDELSRHIVFKGGYVGLRVYHSPRYTLDLDILMQRQRLTWAVERARSAARTDLKDEVNFVFDKTVDLLTQGEYPGTRLVFRACIGRQAPDNQRAQVIHLDIGVGDKVVPRAVDTPLILGGGAISWYVYPPENIAAEKIHALVARGSANSRAKDIFDLCHLLGSCTRDALLLSLRRTFDGRGDVLPGNIAQEISTFDRTLLRKGWASAVGSLRERPDFDEMFEELKRLLDFDTA